VGRGSRGGIARGRISHGYHVGTTFSWVPLWVPNSPRMTPKPGLLPLESRPICAIQTLFSLLITRRSSVQILPGRYLRNSSKARPRRERRLGVSGHVRLGSTSPVGARCSRYAPVVGDAGALLRRRRPLSRTRIHRRLELPGLGGGLVHPAWCPARVARLPRRCLGLARGVASSACAHRVVGGEPCPRASGRFRYRRDVYEVGGSLAARSVRAPDRDCLGYGESDICAGGPESNAGTPQFWNIFGQVAFGESPPRKADSSLGERLRWKVRVLEELSRRGIWLQDASPLGIYLGRGARLDRRH
jgi:hypothetical protein